MPYLVPRLPEGLQHLAFWILVAGGSAAAGGLGARLVKTRLPQSIARTPQAMRRDRGALTAKARRALRADETSEWAARDRRLSAVSANPGQPPDSANPGQPAASANPGQPTASANPGQPPASANPGQPPDSPNGSPVDSLHESPRVAPSTK